MAMDNSPYIVDLPGFTSKTLELVIFHSYVSLPQGNSNPEEMVMLPGDGFKHQPVVAE